MKLTRSGRSRLPLGSLAVCHVYIGSTSVGVDVTVGGRVGAGGGRGPVGIGGKVRVAELEPLTGLYRVLVTE